MKSLQVYNQLNKLETKYKTERTKQENVVLKLRNKTNENKLLRQRITIFSYSGSVILLIILLIFLIISRKKKQELISELTKKMKRLLISRSYCEKLILQKINCFQLLLMTYEIRLIQ